MASSPLSPPPSPLWALGALSSLAAFAITAIALHPLRPDLSVVDSQMSLYLIGPWRHLLQVGYVWLGAGMLALGIGLRRAMAPAAHSGAPLLMFALAAAALSVTAFAWTDRPGGTPTLQGWVHGTSAMSAFLCATTALVLQSLRFGQDPHWRPRRRWALPWALLCFAAVWVLALWRQAPRGLTQKLVIALILGWLFAVALQLLRQTRDARNASALDLRAEDSGTHA